MPRFRVSFLRDLTAPTALPKTAEQHDDWQQANRSWWESNPMRYDQWGEIPYAESTREFYEEIDRRFFAAAHDMMPWKRVPFDPLIDFDALASQDVLEIGVGAGSHAQLLASHARSFTGIDLTSYAVQSTQRRLACFGLGGSVEQMDAEQMRFDDSTFDFVWTWGVIHHSADTRRVLSEIYRVLRPGGRCVSMVYHRSPWGYYVVRGLLRGLFMGEIFRSRGLHSAVQASSDGALARYYSIGEWRALLSERFEVEEIRIYGQKNELLPIPGGRLKQVLSGLLPDAFARFFTNRLRMGEFLVSSFRKPQ